MHAWRWPPYPTPGCVKVEAVPAGAPQTKVLFVFSPHLSALGKTQYGSFHSHQGSHKTEDDSTDSKANLTIPNSNA